MKPTPFQRDVLGLGKAMEQGMAKTRPVRGEYVEFDPESGSGRVLTPNKNNVFASPLGAAWINVTELMEAVAWMESRSGSRQNNYKGPGREQCDSTGCHRVCREIGRMQINPCIQWGISVCNRDNIRFYRGNINCGAAILAARRLKYGSWLSAVKHYNGSGPMADLYLQKALIYIGRRSLEKIE